MKTSNNEHFSFYNSGRLLKNIYRVLKIAMECQPFYTVSTLLLNIILGIIPVVISATVGKLVDGILESVKIGDIRYVVMPIVVYVAFRLSSDIMSAVDIYIGRIWYMRMSDYFQIFILRVHAKFDIAQVIDKTFQDKLQVAFGNGHGPLLDLLDRAVVLIKGSASIVTAGIALAIIDWRALIVLILTSIPDFIIELSYGGQVWNLNAKNSTEKRRFHDLSRFFKSQISFVEAKLNNLHDRFVTQNKRILDNFTEEQIAGDKKKMFRAFVSNIISVSGFTIALILIVNDAIVGAIAIGTVVFAFQTLNSFGGSISLFLNRLAYVLERNLYVNDIFVVADTVPMFLPSPNQKKILGGQAPNIKFEQVSFKYPGQDKLVLNNVTFEIKQGEKIGLVGHNGSGKTTIINLLLRIYDPTQGRILINGIDLREMDLVSWWTMIGILRQDFTEFYFLVKESISVSRKDEGEIQIDRVENSSRISTADGFIHDLPKRYDEQLGTQFGGIDLSKGQKQKLAIARALYKNNGLLILDEPTASIDAESASLIYEAIEGLSEETGAILISHNYATIKRANKIIVLENGSIIEEGTHDNLLASNGFYATSFNKQKADFES